MKKALFIGGTGTISMAITRSLAQNPEWQLYLINRGNRSDDVPANVIVINADINDEAVVAEKIKDLHFDTVCDFIGFVPEHVERDYRLFRQHTDQYMYISSASAYQKPSSGYVMTEGTTMANPYWDYSRNKIACEEVLMHRFRDDNFPVTIIRPSHTYDERQVPLGVHGDKGSWQVLRRMLDGKPVIIHGDGTSLWTVTHNSDFAKGFVGLMANSHAVGGVFQITSDETLSWNQIYESVARALGVKLIPYYVSSDFLASVDKWNFRGALLGDKAVSVVFDNSRLKSAVPGFKATVNFDEGVRRTIEYILSHPECQVEDAEFDEWCDKVIASLEDAKKHILK
ncbi:MAG: SDR family oxidoreductase [Bacteroidaceae bacterium]|nr:SDR family oxidoreductase [Bacteroidaceae bacterium]